MARFCSRFGCATIAEVDTEMGVMCRPHSAPLLYPIIHPDARKDRDLRLPQYVPWEFMQPHERQARHNHDQTLARLAERGGLDVKEALAVVTGCRWNDLPQITRKEAADQFLTLLAAWEKARCTSKT